MKFNTIHVTLKSTSPLIMRRFNVEDLKREPRITGREYDPEKEAERSAYFAEIDGKRQLYIPSIHICAMIMEAAKSYKTGNGLSLRPLLAGTIRIEPEKIPLGTDQYEVHVRHAVFRGHRFPIARAMVPEWEASFNILYMSEILTNPYILRDILEGAGYRVGLGDYRIQLCGPFGTFIVDQFDVKDKEEVMKSQSTAWHGLARRGEVRLGLARQGTARRD